MFVFYIAGTVDVLPLIVYLKATPRFFSSMLSSSCILFPFDSSYASSDCSLSDSLVLIHSIRLHLSYSASFSYTYRPSTFRYLFIDPPLSIVNQTCLPIHWDLFSMNYAHPRIKHFLLEAVKVSYIMMIVQSSCP